MAENIGFSLWCDFIERDFLEDRFKEMVQNGTITGATSNPTIFQQAFLSNSYAEQIAQQRAENPQITKKELYEKLACADIARAAEILAPINEDDPNDGFVSIEVDPNLCDDAKASAEEGKRLFEAIGAKNVMIKIPATKAGCTAMESLIENGISVNATLVFSSAQVEAILDSLKRGYERLKTARKDLDLADLPRAVISIFVSRFDRLCDPQLVQNGVPPMSLGVKNAQRLYKIISEHALPAVRPLFASTAVRGDGHDKAYYVSELLLPYAINTAPLATIAAFMDSGDVPEAYLPENDEIDEYFLMAKSAGVNVEKVAKQLLEDGLEDFKVAFGKILANF